MELGRSTCTSSAWVLNYLADHAAILAHFPEEAQHDVWSTNKAACIATSAAPTGKVTVAPGGYRLDGRWSWCSGLRHSQWIMIGGLIFREGEDHPDMRLFLVPVSEVKQDDTWYCAGLRATGSITSVLDNVFVPEHRTVSFGTLRDAQSPGSKINTNPIYRTPFIAVHSYALLGPALGSARGAYADFVTWTKQRYLTYTQLAIAQHVPVQLKVAEIGAHIDAAELLARRALATARADYSGMTIETRTLLRRDFTYAMRMLRDAMDDLVKICRLQRIDGQQFGAAELARCLRYLFARGDELGRAGGEFRPHGVRLAAQPGLSDVLIPRTGPPSRAHRRLFSPAKRKSRAPIPAAGPEPRNSASTSVVRAAGFTSWEVKPPASYRPRICRSDGRRRLRKILSGPR